MQFDTSNAALLSQLASGAVNLPQLCGSALEEPYDEMLLMHLNALAAAQRGDDVEAYTNLERAHTSFQAAFDKDTAWALPALNVLDLGLRRSASRADAQLKARGEKASKLQEAAAMLQKSFRITVTDRAPIETSKKCAGVAHAPPSRAHPAHVTPPPPPFPAPPSPTAHLRPRCGARWRRRCAPLVP